MDVIVSNLVEDIISEVKFVGGDPQIGDWVEDLYLLANLVEEVR